MYRDQFGEFINGYWDLREHHGWFFGEMMLIWERNKLALKRDTHKPVSPLMGSEAPYCGGGLSGNCLLIIHFTF